MSDVERIKSIEKHSGIFECAQVSAHPLMAGAPPLFRLPHSRWNGISEKELTSHGYSVLTRTADSSIDTFVKQQKSLFVFFQGHPEYESNTILREYRRDVGRYLKGETDTYPSMPRNYFDLPTLSALTALREEAMCRRREEMLLEVSAVLGRKSIQNTWRSTAACIYRNWLEYICAQKKLRLENSKTAAKNISAQSKPGSNSPANAPTIQ
jgi:homoserine O-succinyltransferase